MYGITNPEFMVKSIFQVWFGSIIEHLVTLLSFTFM